ncbi:RnfH family protein [Acinetobacter sp. HY1485]|uniref:RnfH family protein n=1 Tax=Acinetobacter sp. HY1485 TaxID=2970918 RepID=UPI0022B9C9F9|nr:RnfH family protein [Acinetobacter sp. HY1485]
MIWVAYTTPAQQFYVEAPFKEGMSVQDAIEQSGLDLPQDFVCGIFSEKVGLDTVLNDGDRVEIYRPLTINPKEIRRNRAKQLR